MVEGFRLGIDFGTSTTVAALRQRDMPAEVLEIDGRRGLPSVLYVDDDQTLIVGGVAEELLVGQPARGLRSVKSLLGQPTPAVLAGRTFRIAELVAAVLQRTLTVAVERMGGPPQQVFVTAPADWTERQLTQFRQALTLAGMDDATIVSEPVAAAFGLGERVPHEPGAPLLIYDLGGGTLDIAVVAASADGFDVIGRPRGDRSLGGDLFDEVLLSHVGEQHLPRATWDALCASQDPQWERALAGTRSEVRRAKELLSRHPYATLTLPMPDGMRVLKLERDEAFSVLRPFVLESVSLVERTLTDAAVPAGQLRAVCLAGGGSSLPLIEQVLGESFAPIPIVRAADPKGVVAIGAVSMFDDIVPSSSSLTGPISRTAPPAPPAPPVEQGQSPLPGGIPAPPVPVGAAPEVVTPPEAAPPAAAPLAVESAPFFQEVASPSERPAAPPSATPTGEVPVAPAMFSVPNGPAAASPPPAQFPETDSGLGAGAEMPPVPSVPFIAERDDSATVPPPWMSPIPPTPPAETSGRPPSAKGRRVAALSSVAVVAVIAVVAGVLLSRSGDDGSSGDTAAGAGATTTSARPASSAEPDTTVTSEATTTSTTAPVPTGPPQSMEQWEALWAAERAQVVADIKAAGGVSGTTARGAGGFVLDLSRCPAGWSDTEGLSDTEIRIGHTTAQSGVLADYGNIARAIETQIKAVNDAGGITDSTGRTRTINFIVKDDGYDAARTIPLVDELIDTDRVFAAWTLGSPGTMKVYDKLNQRCVPHPLSMTGHPAWGDPVNHPWTTGMQLAYNTEALLWGSFIEAHAAELRATGGKITIAALVMNNDFGKAYDLGFKEWLARSPLAAEIDYVTETIEPSAPTVTSPMNSLAAQSPDMFIAMVAGTPCTQSITEADQNGIRQTALYLFQPSVCAANSFVGQSRVGTAANGWWVVGGATKDLNSSAFDSDPYVQFARGQLAANGLDHTSSGSFGSGYFFGWAFLQALRIAAELDGGLTRSNLMLAVRSMRMTHPYLIDGAAFNLSGAADAYFVEAGVFSTRDAASEAWMAQGPPVDISGSTKNCAFNPAIALCT